LNFFLGSGPEIKFVDDELYKKIEFRSRERNWNYARLQ